MRNAFTRRAFRCLLPGTVLAVALAAPTAHAQAGSGDDAYPRAWFAEPSIANAWDMLQRVPGFAVVDADADVRGYGEALGNVLVDGVRPASKRESIASLLKRIPADAVERIELVRAGGPGIDMGGHALLANVVRARRATTRGAAELGVAGGTEGWRAPTGRFEYARRWQDRSLELALRDEPELDDDSGRGDIRTWRADGAPAVRERLDTRTTKSRREASAAWRQPWAGGTLALDAALRSERERERTLTTPDGGASQAEHVRGAEDDAEAEFALRFRRALDARSSLELFASRRDADLDAREDSTDDADADGAESFREDTAASETILRADLRHERTPRLAFSAALEAARNTLDSRASLARAGGAPVALPGSRVGIAEQRYEASAGASWQGDDGFALDAGLRLEQSAIAQRGDAPLRRSFRQAKPRIAARWRHGPRDRFRLVLSREVGQLDFEDFVASASLGTGSVSAGNAELRPEQAWRLQAEWERRFGDEAALTLGWTHERVGDVVDRVLVAAPGDAFDAPGNIGRGRRDALSLELAMPFAAAAIPGGRLRASLRYRDSRVTDPFTGMPRRISEEKPVDGEVSLSGELPRWNASWGFDLDHIAEREAKYRFDRIERKSEGLGWTLHAERRFAGGWRLRAEATDLGGRRFESSRVRYDGARPGAALRDRELRRRRAPGTFVLSLRYDFGG